MLNTILLGILGGQEILIIAIIILLLFGGAKIPQLMRGLGKGMKEFKDATNEITKSADDAADSQNNNEVSSNKK